LEKSLAGQLQKALEVENYPGYKMISGFDLMMKFQDQAKTPRSRRNN
jgi:thioredoxin reductase